MLLRDLLPGVALLLMLNGCAPLPAQCARPVGQMPEAPQAQQQSRRLVASLSGAQNCHVMVRVPDDSSTSSLAAAREEAVKEASIAAQTCCATPRASNLGDWPAGATAFDLEFDCAAP